MDDEIVQVHNNATRFAVAAMVAFAAVIGVGMAAGPLNMLVVRVLGALIAMSSSVLAVRATRVGVTGSRTGLTIHGFVKTRNIPWVEVSDLKVGPGSSALPTDVLQINGADGRTRRVQVTGRTAMFGATSSTLAENVEQLRHLRETYGS